MSPLTREQLSALGARLEDRHRALLRETRDELERAEARQYAETAGRGPVDEGDQSVDDELADLSLAMTNRHVREIREIEAAKARIDDGSYGICIDCGREIGYERLLAQPTAVRCHSCQEQWERTHAHDGAPKI